MAIQVDTDYQTPFGLTVPSLYWRWTNLTVTVQTNTAIVTLQGYVSEDAFNAGAVHVASRSFTITGMQFGMMVLAAPSGPTLSDAISNAIYTYAKTNDMYFASATDVVAV